MVYAQYGLELGGTAEVVGTVEGDTPEGELSGKADGVRVGNTTGVAGLCDEQAVNRINGNSM